MKHVFRGFVKQAFKNSYYKPRGRGKHSEIEKVRAQEAKGERATTPIEAGRDYPVADYKRVWP